MSCYPSRDFADPHIGKPCHSPMTNIHPHERTIFMLCYIPFMSCFHFDTHSGFNVMVFECDDACVLNRNFVEQNFSFTIAVLCEFFTGCSFTQLFFFFPLVFKFFGCNSIWCHFSLLALTTWHWWRSSSSNELFWFCVATTPVSLAMMFEPQVFNIWGRFVGMYQWCNVPTEHMCAWSRQGQLKSIFRPYWSCGSLLWVFPKISGHWWCPSLDIQMSVINFALRITLALSLLKHLKSAKH